MVVDAIDEQDSTFACRSALAVSRPPKPPPTMITRLERDISPDLMGPGRGMSRRRVSTTDTRSAPSRNIGLRVRLDRAGLGQRQAEGRYPTRVEAIRRARC